MKYEKRIPFEFQPMLDELIDRPTEDVKEAAFPKQLQDLDAWFVEQGYELLVETWNDEFVLDLVKIAENKFNDPELESYLDRQSSGQVDDAVRLDYCKNQIAVEDADVLSEYVYSPHMIPIESCASGRSAILGCIARVNTQVGVGECQCLGIFDSNDGFLSAIKNMGFISMLELEKIEDQLLLDLWGWTGRKLLMQPRHPLIADRLSS